MKPASARALWIAALILALVVSMVPSPGGRFFLSLLAALLALPPVIFGPGRARVGGAVACLLSLVLAIAAFPAMQKDRAVHAEFAKRKDTATIVPQLSAECSESVPLATLIAAPEQYHGKALRVVAHVTIEFENMSACPSANETEMKHCLWLDIGDGPYKTDQDYARYQSRLQVWERFNRQTVAMHATLDKSLQGHFSMWPAGLRNVRELAGNRDGWDFAANAAAPRSACVDADRP